MEVLYRHGCVSVCQLTELSEKSALLALFRQVAEELHWEARNEICRVHDLSYFYTAHLDGHLAGGIEIRQPDSAGFLPIHSTWPEIAESAIESPANVVVLAIAQRFRNTPQLLWTLCTEVWRSCGQLGVKNLLMEVPVQNYRIYQRLGWALEIIGAERDHWSEPCYPCRINIDVLEQSIVAKVEKAPSLRHITDQAYRSD